MEVDVVVIGAGISGLSAAKVLKEKKLKVLVLEAKDKVGGRMKTIKNHEFGYIDLGAAYIGPTQKNILRLCKELGLSLYTVNEEEKTVMNWKGKWAVYDGMIPPVWNPIKLLDLNHIQRSLNMMAKQVPTSWPWTADKAAEWDSLTVQHYLDKTCWTKFSKDLVTLLVRTTLTAEPYEVSLLFLLWYINCGGGIDSLCSITNGAQEKKIVGGSKQVCEKLAEKLEGKIKLSTPVVAIEQQKDVAIVTDLHGKKYKAKFIISAIPQTFLNRIAFHPPLPAVKQQLIQRMPMGAVIKTVMYYPTAFWRKFGLNGSSMTNFGPVAYTIDDTRPNEEFPAIMGFIDADKAREMSEMTKEERKNIIKEYYAEAFKSHQFFNPIGYAEKNWMGEDYLGGVFYMPPGALSKYGSMLRKPIGRVHFAGTEAATQWVGYMDGAVQAGERAAREVLFNFGIIDRSKIWWQDNKNISCSPGNYGPSWIEWILPSITRLLQSIGAFLLGFAIYEYYPMFTGWRAVMLYKLYQFIDKD